MKPYSYKVSKSIFDKRTLTQLQHKLRVALKCYTVTNFKMVPNNQIENYFEFKITYRKNKIQFGEDKIHSGFFSKEFIDEDNYLITIKIYN